MLPDYSTAAAPGAIAFAGFAGAFPKSAPVPWAAFFQRVVSGQSISGCSRPVRR